MIESQEETPVGGGRVRKGSNEEELRRTDEGPACPDASPKGADGRVREVHGQIAEDSLSLVPTEEMARQLNRRLSLPFAISLATSLALAGLGAFAALKNTGVSMAAPLAGCATFVAMLAITRRLLIEPTMRRAWRRSPLVPERQAELRAYLEDHPELRATRYWLDASPSQSPLAPSHGAAVTASEGHA